MRVLLATTGTSSPVVISDLNGVSFMHPTVEFDLLSEFTLEELYESVDLPAAVAAGTITLVDDQRQPITASYQLSPVSDGSVKRMRTDNMLMMGG
jgi:hypothetical protein